MRWLGMIAALATLAAAVFNIIVFSRLKLDFGGFATVGLATAAFMAFTVGLGIVTVRMMQRREEEAERAEQAQRMERAEREPSAAGDAKAGHGAVREEDGT